MLEAGRAFPRLGSVPPARLADRLCPFAASLSHVVGRPSSSRRVRCGPRARVGVDLEPEPCHRWSLPLVTSIRRLHPGGVARLSLPGLPCYRRPLRRIDPVASSTRVAVRTPPPPPLLPGGTLVPPVHSAIHCSVGLWLCRRYPL